MSSRGPQSIRIGGTTYRVTTTASDEEVERLSGLVDQRLRALNKQNRPVTPQMFLLVAMSFAHDAEAAEAKRRATKHDAENAVRGLLARIDAALAEADAAPEPDGGDDDAPAPTLRPVP